MRKRKPDLGRQLRRLEAQRARALRTLLTRTPLLRGSLSRVMRTCGKPRCHCARQPAHPAWTLSTVTAAKKRRCQVVRQADVERVAAQVVAYREFRAALRRFQAIHNEQKALFTGWLEERAITYE